MSDEQQKHFDQQLGVLNEVLTTLQTSFDSRLLAAGLADRAAYMYHLLVSAGHMTEEDARLSWEEAGKRIQETPTKEVQTLTKAGDEVFDPSERH